LTEVKKNYSPRTLGGTGKKGGGYVHACNRPFRAGGEVNGGKKGKWGERVADCLLKGRTNSKVCGTSWGGGHMGEGRATCSAIWGGKGGVKRLGKSRCVLATIVEKAVWKLALHLKT